MPDYSTAIKRLEERIKKLKEVYKQMPFQLLQDEVTDITEEYFRLTKEPPPQRYVTVLADMIIENSLINERENAKGKAC